MSSGNENESRKKFWGPIIVALIGAAATITAALLAVPEFREAIFPPAVNAEDNVSKNDINQKAPVNEESPSQTVTEIDLVPVGGGTGNLLFVSQRDGDNEIFVIQVGLLDGSMAAVGEPEQLTRNSDASDTFPDWSPDGTQIVYQSNRGGSYDLFIMDYMTRSIRPLVSSSGLDSSPSWSPDGNLIAYHSNEDGDRDIYMVDAGASGWSPEQITMTSAEELSPDWSPAGDRIVFFSDRDGDYRLYLMDTDGENQSRLTEVWGQDPDWSTDGAWIVFASCQEEFVCDIYVTAADGSGEPECLTCEDSGSDMEPAWSPDGSMIAFSSDRAGNWEIYTMNADGSDLFRVTYDSEWDGAPCWQP